MRRCLALLLALSLLSPGLAGCSQPIDTGSSVPAQSQPIVALLALLGLGIGIAAWDRHVDNHKGAGGTTAIFGANFTVAPFIGGYKPVDLAPDLANSAIGALEVPTAGGGTGKFTEIQSAGSSGIAFATENLAPNYAPSAVALDPTGATWFVNGTGSVQECNTITPGTTQCASSIGPFSDGLGTGFRSIAADTNFVFVVMDGGGGKVKWWAESITSSPLASGSGTYTPSSSTSPVFPADAIEATEQTGGVADFTVYHQDGTTDNVTFSVSGTTVSINPQPNMTLNPAPLVAVSNAAPDSQVAFYSFTGSPSGAYDLTKFVAPALVGLTQPTTKSELIALNGQVGNPGNGNFAAPLAAVHYDSGEASLWAIDRAGDIVNFSTF